MTPMRRQIAEHMVLSRRTSAHVTTVFEVEMSRVVEARARYSEEFERRNGIKLTYTPFVVRAAVEAIKQFPIFNASVDGSNIVYKKSINLGVAVALETGLIVPVIKQAEEKNFLGIARAVQDVAERARTKKLSVDDVQGGTFTITNPGVFGSLFGTPIINQPQVAILGVGVIEKRAVVRNDAIAIRPMVYLALSFDHRVIDGAIADQFMARIKEKLESWDEVVL
jgi:2-oxoglutarate dehydrogenase E2 component (dihydrolipoamide succinyltransferase)